MIDEMRGRDTVVVYDAGPDDVEFRVDTMLTYAAEGAPTGTTNVLMLECEGGLTPSGARLLAKMLVAWANENGG